MRTTSFALALASFFAVHAQARADDCIFLRTIDGFNVIDDKTLIVHTGPSSDYRVNLFGICPDLRWSETIAIDSRDGQVCWPSNSHIITLQNGIKHRCMIDSVVKLSKKDLEQLQTAKKAK